MARGAHDLGPPDGGYGWVVVIVFIVINSCLLPLTQCFGIIYAERYYSMLDLTATKVSFLLHLHNFMMCALGIFSGPLLKKFDYRQVSLLGSALVCFGVFITTFANSYEVLLLTIGIIIGTGQAILLPGVYIGVNSYFKKRLILAISVQVTGASLSQIFMPHVCHYLIQTYGLHGTILVLSAIAFNALPLTILLRPVGVKSKTKNIHHDEVIVKMCIVFLEFEKKLSAEQLQENGTERMLGPVYQETTYRKQEDKQSRLREFMKTMDFSLFGDRVYVIIVLGMGISFASELNIILMMPFVLSELAHFDSKRVASALSVQAFADLVGRLVVPFWAHKFDAAPKIMYLLSLAIACISRTLLSVYFSHTFVVYFALTLLGLAKGIKAVYQSVIIPKFVSFDKLAAATGLSMMCNGVLSLVIGPMIGWTHDMSGSYICTLHVASAFSMFCICLWIGEFIFSAKSVVKSAELSNEVNIT